MMGKLASLVLEMVLHHPMTPSKACEMVDDTIDKMASRHITTKSTKEGEDGKKEKKSKVDVAKAKDEVRRQFMQGLGVMAARIDQDYERQALGGLYDDIMEYEGRMVQ